MIGTTAVSADTEALRVFVDRGGAARETLDGVRTQLAQARAAAGDGTVPEFVTDGVLLELIGQMHGVERFVDEIAEALQSSHVRRGSMRQLSATRVQWFVDQAGIAINAPNPTATGGVIIDFESAIDEAIGDGNLTIAQDLEDRWALEMVGTRSTDPDRLDRFNELVQRGMSPWAAANITAGLVEEPVSPTDLDYLAAEATAALGDRDHPLDERAQLLLPLQIRETIERQRLPPPADHARNRHAHTDRQDEIATLGFDDLTGAQQEVAVVDLLHREGIYRESEHWLGMRIGRWLTTTPDTEITGETATVVTDHLSRESSDFSIPFAAQFEATDMAVLANRDIDGTTIGADPELAALFGQPFGLAASSGQLTFDGNDLMTVADPVSAGIPTHNTADHYSPVTLINAAPSTYPDHFIADAASTLVIRSHHEHTEPLRHTQPTEPADQQDTRAVLINVLHTRPMSAKQRFLSNFDNDLEPLLRPRNPIHHNANGSNLTTDLVVALITDSESGRATTHQLIDAAGQQDAPYPLYIADALQHGLLEHRLLAPEYGTDNHPNAPGSNEIDNTLDAIFLSGSGDALTLYDELAIPGLATLGTEIGFDAIPPQAFQETGEIKGRIQTAAYRARHELAAHQDNRDATTRKWATVVIDSIVGTLAAGTPLNVPASVVVDATTDLLISNTVNNALPGGHLQHAHTQTIDDLATDTEENEYQFINALHQLNALPKTRNNLEIPQPETPLTGEQAKGIRDGDGYQSLLLAGRGGTVEFSDALRRLHDLDVAISEMQNRIIDG